MTCAIEAEGVLVSDAPGLVDKKYRIDPEKSGVTWIGSSLSVRHTGSLSISEGELTIERGQLTGGRIVINMSSMTDADLQQTDYRSQLVAHLLSEDFFEVSLYPRAEALLKRWYAIPGAAAGTPNYLIDADLTIKGITRPVRFEAVIEPQAGMGLKAHAALDIDRTKWNVTYGSGEVTEKRGMHLVNNTVTMEILLFAQ